MTILVFGADGQVGNAVCERAPDEAIGVDIKDCDIRDQRAVVELIARIRPSVVMNCAAYTAVDRAEIDREGAFAVNATGAGNIARAAAAAGRPVFHISTDYVFAGDQQGAYRESDAIAPLNVYGQSKAGGDEEVAASNPVHIVLRVAWVFSPIGSNFVKTMLKLGRERPALSVVDDQIGGPTEARDIADALLALSRHCRAPGFSDWGVYHFAGAPATSWYKFACAIFEKSHGPKPTLKPIATADYPLPARRPLVSQLDCTKIKQVFGIDQPDWRLSLSRVVESLERRA